MSKPKPQKKKSLTTLWADIKAIRDRRPTDAQIEELNRVLNGDAPKDKKRSAHEPEAEG
jgi:hypothetical protein